MKMNLEPDVITRPPITAQRLDHYRDLAGGNLHFSAGLRAREDATLMRGLKAPMTHL